MTFPPRAIHVLLNIRQRGRHRVRLYSIYMRFIAVFSNSAAYIWYKTYTKLDHNKYENIMEWRTSVVVWNVVGTSVFRKPNNRLKVPHCGVFSSPHSHPSWAQIFTSPIKTSKANEMVDEHNGALDLLTGRNVMSIRMKWNKISPYQVNVPIVPNRQTLRMLLYWWKASMCNTEF